MASMFCAILFIKNASNANKYTAGTAVYRAGDDEFVEYKFKAFRSEFTPLVKEICDNQTLYNLPVSPVIGIFTGPIQDPAITENGQ
ncbi:24983_t:CDS:2, partial [Gigaspora rosea]